jgi:16S rRNA (uracil1498-N3)-methyltransferase
MDSGRQGTPVGRPRRFFSERPLQPGERVLTGPTARHAAGVLRLRSGEHIVLFDGSGLEFPAEILSIRRQEVRVVVGDGALVNRESPLSLHLGVGLSQSGAMDLVVQKATELGVAEIIPMATERSQGWLAGKRGKDRQVRWKRIAQEAARQCGRNRIPRVAQVAHFSQVVRQEASPAAVRLIFWEEETRRGLREVFTAHGPVSEVHLLIGPEGGFSSAEATAALTAGFHIVSLGPRILRAETAAIAVVSLLQYEMGDLGVAR